MKSVHVLLDDLHRFNLLEPGSFADLIFRIRIKVAFQMPYIRDIPYISHVVAGMHQVTIDDIETYKRSAITYMNIIVYRWSADIHADPPLNNGCKYFLGACITIINLQTHASKNKLLERGSGAGFWLNANSGADRVMVAMTDMMGRMIFKYDVFRPKDIINAQ